MTAIKTPFASQSGKYAFLGSMSLENCYLEVQEGSKDRQVIVPSEGLIEFAEVDVSPCRGEIYLEDIDAIYSFHSSSVWKTIEAGTSVRVGTIPGIDRVQITRNKKVTPQITVRCDAGIYYIEEDQVRIISDPDLPEVASVETLGEFTLFGIEDGRVFYSTQGETSAIDALSFFTAEQSADKLIRLKVDRGELLIFSQFTTEVWSFTGNEDTPFEYRTTIQRGILARDTVATCDGTVMWAGLSREGEKGIYRLEGYNPKKISNHEIDRLIEAEDDPSTLLAYSYGKAGHSFYVLKGTDWTRTYDAATGQWHSRKTVGLDVWRTQFSLQAWGKTILGDQMSGKLLYLDSNTYMEDGEEMVFKIRTPFMHAFPNGGIVDLLSVDFLVGQGVTSPTAQGYDPVLMISKSTDGGNTFSFPRHLPLGRRGAFETRVNSRRWGRFGPKGVVWELSVTDPVGRALALMDAKVRPLAA